MSLVPPNRKSFLDIRLVQECMDNQSKMIAIAFGYFLSCYKPVIFNGWSEPTMVYQQGGVDYTVEQLYNKFIESITNGNKLG